MIHLIHEDSLAKNNGTGIAEVGSMHMVLSALQVVPNHI